MKNRIGNKGASFIIGAFFGIIILLLFTLASKIAYSDSGYMLTYYPDESAKEFTVCIEGEINPTNQSFTITDIQDKKTTINPFVIVNDAKYAFNTSVRNEQMKERISELKIGCNKVKFGAASDSEFLLEIGYNPHWRPVVKNLQIRGLKSNEHSKFFIVIEDPESYKQGLQTSLWIKDVTSSHTQRIVYNESFEGLSNEVKLDSGNYRAYMRVYDGYAWSDTYEVFFTVMVVRTDEFFYLKVNDAQRDDEPIAYDGKIPIAISQTQGKGIRELVRVYDGMYVVLWKSKNYVQWIAHTVKNEYIG